MTNTLMKEIAQLKVIDDRLSLLKRCLSECVPFFPSINLFEGFETDRQNLLNSSMALRHYVEANNKPKEV